MSLPFEGLKKTMRTIQSDFVVDVVRSVVEKNSNEIIELNTQKQLFEKGIGSDEKRLEPFPYSNPYEKLKKRIGQPTDRITLRLEGDFYKSFQVVIGNEQFQINATDFKTKFLLKRYGQKVLGLTSSNVSEFNQMVIRPELLKEIRKKINL